MKYILMTCLLFSIISRGSAQNGPTEIVAANYEQMAQGETTRLTSLLSLTAVQADSVLQINRHYYNRIAALRSQQLSLAERGEQLQQVESERNSRLQNNLTADQYNRFVEDGLRIRRRLDSLQAAHRPHHQ